MSDESILIYSILSVIILGFIVKIIIAFPEDEDFSDDEEWGG